MFTHFYHMEVSEVKKCKLDMNMWVLKCNYISQTKKQKSFP